jgi:hypothetical protein
MSADFRHHKASYAPPNVIIVPVPFEGGSPKHARDIKPRPYPSQRREHWQPAQRPPRSKGEATVRLIDAINRQVALVRELLRPNPALIKAWWAGQATV